MITYDGFYTPGSAEDTSSSSSPEHFPGPRSRGMDVRDERDIYRPPKDQTLSHPILALIQGDEDSRPFVTLGMVDARPVNGEVPRESKLSLFVTCGTVWGRFEVGPVVGIFKCDRKLGGRTESLTFTWRGLDHEKMLIYGGAHKGFLLFYPDGTVQMQWHDIPSRFGSACLLWGGELTELDLGDIFDAWDSFDWC